MLAAVFRRADASENGKLSLDEYLDICTEYGVEVSEQELETVKVNI